MKHRFETDKQHRFYRNTILSVLLFFLVIGAFSYGITQVADRTQERALETLENALDRGITRCYSLEGRYPDSLEYLEQNYGLVYDKERFLVMYQPVASNIRPVVQVIDREENP